MCTLEYKCFPALTEWNIIDPHHTCFSLLGIAAAEQTDAAVLTGSNFTDYQIIEWLGLEGPSRIIRFQPPATDRAANSRSSTRSGCRGPHQPSFENPQGRGIHKISGQLVPATYHPLSEKPPSDIQSKSSAFQFKYM